MDQDSPCPDWRSEFPFESRWLEQQDVRMHYVDEYAPNDKAASERVSPTALLFVHGNPTWSFHWRRLIHALRRQYRCVAMDHLGCGLSDSQPRPLRLADHIANLRRLIRKLDLNRVTLVAQDWGGAIGLGALLEDRERFERIILFNTGAFPPPFIPWRIRVCRWPGIGKLAVQGGNVFSRAALKMTLSRSAKLDPTAAAGYLAPYDSWKRRAAVYQFTRDIPLSARHPTWQTLQRIESRLPSLADWPIHLIWGMQDWCFTPACLDRLCAAWPAAEVRRLDDVGHWVIEDAPDDALASMSQFLRQTTADRESSNARSREGDPTVAPTEDSTVLGTGSRKPL